MASRLRLPVSFPLALLAAAAAVTLGRATPPDDAAAIAFFEKNVRPVLVNNCYTCHSANTNSKGGLRVDDRNGLIQGGGRGAAVVPGHPEKSLLLQAVRHTHDKVKMPPNKHLSAREIADLTQWISDGAAWPRPAIPASLGKQKAKYAQQRREHWAWQPLREPKLPQVRDTGWARADMDRYVLAGLAAKGLAPVRDADRPTLLRRVTFDLTGLPPTPAEMDSFVADDSPDALARVVDRLLASPAFGERWGRHWLDVARYGESTGPSRNIPYPHAWRYRDYVIDAFDSDKPYNQFLREQIAGDLLPAASGAQRDAQLIATGFLALGGHDVNQRFKVRFVMDNVDDQIDTVCRAVLGLTVSCARCHDHKYEPIPTTEYYALAGIFCSTDLCAGIRNKMGGGGLDYYDTAMLLRLGPEPKADPERPRKIEQARAALAKARKELTMLREKPDKNVAPAERQKRIDAESKRVQKLDDELFALTDPAASGPLALGVRDARTIGDTEIRIRGQAEQLGPVVPRGFLSVIDMPGAPKIDAGHSGRLELAQWLTHEQNPLTPRVMVNRVWKHLFGQGLVSSVDNFGVTGEQPSHPELLDYLAARFVRDGWSVKKLVRLLVLSRTYHLSSETSAAHLAVDPANRLLWRHGPRRLDAEEIRDAMLASSGKLDRIRPQASPARDLKVVELTDNGAVAQRLIEAAAKSVHRSVYLPLFRGLTPRPLEVFDFAEQGMVTGSRDATTVVTQALYLLNDAFVRQQSQALAERLLGRADLDDAGRIALAYRLSLGRAATAREQDRVKGYVAEYQAATRAAPGASRAAAWASFCQALLASAEFRYLR